MKNSGGYPVRIFRKAIPNRIGVQRPRGEDDVLGRDVLQLPELRAFGIWREKIEIRIKIIMK